MRFATITAAALALTTLPTIAAPLTPIAAAAKTLVGPWSGVSQQRQGAFARDVPVSIEVVEKDGALFLVDHDRVRGGGDPLLLVQENGAWVARYPAMPAGATEITLTPAGAALTFSIRNEGPIPLNSYTTTLRHNDPAAKKFFAARLDAQGNRITAYRYTPPRQSATGVPVSDAKAEGVDPAMMEQMVNAVLAETGDLRRQQTDGILIMRNGKLILEEYFWGQSADNPHDISSGTKSVVSILTGIAWDQRKIDLDRPVAAYFADRADSLWVKNNAPVTVRNMLSMASGTDWDDSKAAASLALIASTDIAGLMLNRKQVLEPGAKFNYDNGLPSLDGLLVERVTGEPLATFAERTLFKPLAISNYKWQPTRDHDRPLAAGGFVMRPLDMAKLGQLMLDGGKWQGQQIVSQAWVEESTTQQTRKGDYPYGFYWHLTNADKRHVSQFDGYSAIGQGGQYITVLPQAKLVIVMTSSTWKPPTTQDKAMTPVAPFDLMNRYIVPAIAP